MACSRTIENAMTAEFFQKGMLSCQIALLTHKMRIVFIYSEYDRHGLTPEMITSEVEMVGFSAELLELIENNPEGLMKDGVLYSQESNSNLAA